MRPPPASTLFPYTTLFRSRTLQQEGARREEAAVLGARRQRQYEQSFAQPYSGTFQRRARVLVDHRTDISGGIQRIADQQCLDRKSTRLNSSHSSISYAVFC